VRRWLVLLLIAAPALLRGQARDQKALAFEVASIKPTAWKDPSRHTVKFVTVEPDVKLEVLDWGGSGRPVVLLTGYGNSAHVFDIFAEKLSQTNHVYGITRRGFGYSSLVTHGYNVQRLAQDVLVVLDTLKIPAPVLIGHSLGGKEMTVLGKRSDRIAGFVYLDGLSDPTYDFTDYNNLLAKRPPNRYPSPPPPRGSPTFDEYMKWQMYGRGVSFPEGDVRAMTTTTPDGRMGERRIASHIGELITAGNPRPDYASIRVPVLAFVAVPIPVEDQLQNYEIRNEQDRKNLQDLYVAQQKYTTEFTSALTNVVPKARVIRVIGADHYIFISNEAEVLFETRSFLKRLESR
jgi:pimeloyl-ACP methyl ester carboxylesterase